MTRFVTDLSSLVDMGSPNASLAHPPQLHQGLFIDTAELHSTGLQPAADYPQYSDITRQHEARAMGTRAAIERFCASSDPLKRLVVEKEVYGWDLKRVRAGEAPPRRFVVKARAELHPQQDSRAPSKRRRTSRRSTWSGSATSSPSSFDPTLSSLACWSFLL